MPVIEDNQEIVEVVVMDEEELPLNDIKQEFQDIAEIKKEEVSIEIIEKDEKVNKVQNYSLIDQLVNFLDKQESKGMDDLGLNSTLSGYFCKVVLVLINSQPKEMAKYIIAKEFRPLELMLDHIDNKSIVELLVKCLLLLTDNSPLPGIAEQN